MSPLTTAIDDNNISAIKKLTQDRQVLKTRNHDGETPLFSLRLSGRPATAKLLLERGADVNARNKDQQTMLHVVPNYHQRGGAGLVDVLIRWGANVDAADERGSTPLHFAVGRSKPTIASRLIKAGANVNAQDMNGDTPLYSSVYHGDLKTAKVLVDAGADINLKNNDRGETPLHEAAWKARTDMIKLMMRPGTDLNVTTKSGKTLIALAIQSKSDEGAEAAELLFEKGAPASVRELRILESIRGGLSLSAARELYQRGTPSTTVRLSPEL